jgi:hypothetical protein
MEFKPNKQGNIDEVTINAGKVDNQLLFRILLMKADSSRDHKLTYRITLTAEHDSPTIEDPRWKEQRETINQLIKKSNELETSQRELKATLDQHTLQIDELVSKYKKQQQELTSMQNQISQQATQIQQLQQAAFVPRRVDPLSICLSNGPNTTAIGFQVQDPKDYVIHGPYKGVTCFAGDFMQAVNYSLIENEQDKVSLSGQRWPQKFIATFKPHYRWCEVYSAIDGGLSHTFMFPHQYDNKKDICLDVYRFDKSEVYHINSIEIAIYKDSDSLQIPTK